MSQGQTPGSRLLRLNIAYGPGKATDNRQPQSRDALLGWDASASVTAERTQGAPSRKYLGSRKGLDLWSHTAGISEQLLPGLPVGKLLDFSEPQFQCIGHCNSPYRLIDRVTMHV